MIQGGCPRGDGRGGPGYTFDDEIHPELAFDKPYLLAMANAGKQGGKGTNGSQFFITVEPTSWLQGKHTIFGEVADQSSRDVVDAIVAVPTGPGDAPREPVVIESVTRPPTDRSTTAARRDRPVSTPAQPPAGPPVGPAAEPVCPRHPDRVSYVRCQRCERPVCPECQRQAAVGVQCVDCVREQAKTVRTGAHHVRRPGPRRPPGRHLHADRHLRRRLPAAAACPAPTSPSRFAFVPALADDQPYRFLTAAFLHSPGCRCTSCST